MKPNQCMWCGKFDSYERMDSYIPFGCSNPASPEPHDPTVLCHKCSDQLYEQYKKAFQHGRYDGDWQKSRAEIKAASECGLSWVHSSGVNVAGKRVSYQYVETSKIKEL